jgi:protein SCO1/2
VTSVTGSAGGLAAGDLSGFQPGAAGGAARPEQALVGQDSILLADFQSAKPAFSRRCRGRQTIRSKSMKSAILLTAVCLSLAPLSHAAAKRYPVTGVILKIDRPHRTFVATCAAIPGYMEAMVMPFTVREETALDGLEASTPVEFTLVVENGHSYAEAIRVHHYESMEQEPLRARRLQLLAVPGTDSLTLGQPVADFALTDQTGQRVALSQFAGKVVALTFIYTSCPLPDYCFRLSNNFGRLNKRFADRMGRDLVLLSITFDPVHDQPKVLAKYASTWKADPKSWRFLTGALPEVKDVCRHFGLNFWQEEGSLTHSLHTVVIDRHGKLAANFEGNEFTAEQLGDFVEVEMRKQ